MFYGGLLKIDTIPYTIIMLTTDQLLTIMLRNFLKLNKGLSLLFDQANELAEKLSCHFLVY